MDLLQTYDREIAGSDERIAKCERLMAEAAGKPDGGPAMSMLSKMLDSERRHRQTMQDTRAEHLQALRRMARTRVRVRIMAAVALIGAIAALVLQHSARH